MAWTNASTPSCVAPRAPVLVIANRTTNEMELASPMRPASCCNFTRSSDRPRASVEGIGGGRLSALVALGFAAPVPALGAGFARLLGAWPGLPLEGGRGLAILWPVVVACAAWSLWSVCQTHQRVSPAPRRPDPCPHPRHLMGNRRPAANPPETWAIGRGRGDAARMGEAGCSRGAGGGCEARRGVEAEGGLAAAAATTAGGDGRRRAAITNRRRGVARTLPRQARCRRRRRSQPVCAVCGGRDERPWGGPP